MLYLYGVLIGASVLALISDNRTNLDNGNPPKKDLFYFFTAALLICFVGLRTQMNDTFAYMRSFSRLEPFENIDWAIGSNPFFYIYESFLKKFITTSPNAFIFISAFFVVGTYVWFIKKYSANFGYSIFVLIAMGVYGFSASAMKQTLSIAFALIAVDLYLRKKWIFSALLLVVAVLFHPYVIVYAAVPFLTNGVWNKKSALIIAGTFIVGAGFSTFIAKILEVTDAIGENYDASKFDPGTGVNPLRILMYMVVPLVSFIARNEIKEKNDKALNLFVNLSLLTACFSFLSFFGGAVATGRMARYFDLFQCLVLPYVVCKCFPNKQNQQLIILGSIVCYLIYYYYYYNIYAWMGFTADVYNRISLIDLFKGWRG